MCKIASKSDQLLNLVVRLSRWQEGAYQVKFSPPHLAIHVIGIWYRVIFFTVHRKKLVF